MARTPRPEGSEPKVFFLKPENDAYLTARTTEVLRLFTEVVNSELDFLRHWGLSRISYSRLAHAAKLAGASPLEYVQTLVHRAALNATASPPPKREPVESGTIRRSINFTEPNLALIAHYSMLNRTEFSATVNWLLDFARTYSLPPHLLAALTAQAASRGGTLRDLVLTIITDHVATLPEPPLKSKR